MISAKASGAWKVQWWYRMELEAVKRWGHGAARELRGIEGNGLVCGV